LQVNILSILLLNISGFLKKRYNSIIPWRHNSTINLLFKINPFQNLVLAESNSKLFASFESFHYSNLSRNSNLSWQILQNFKSCAIMYNRVIISIFRKSLENFLKITILLKEGWNVDNEVRAFLDYIKSLGGAPIHKLSPEKNRSGEKYLIRKAGMAPQDVAKVEERLIPVDDGEIALRIYTPGGVGPFPIFVFFHGGGWVIGDLDSVDAPLRMLVNSSGWIVVSVDYRLAPEHKYPVAVNDCYLATKWVAENAASFQGDSTKIAVGGESAGGNLAAVVTFKARENGMPFLCYQILIYPATDFVGDHPSWGKFGGTFLYRKDMEYFINHYVSNPEDRNSMYASPLLAADLKGLPPALVVTAGVDPLHDEGEAYARRLQEAGVEVTYHCYEGMIHGFLVYGGMIKKAAELVELMAQTLKGLV